MIHSSDDAEQLWPMVHAEQGPHFVGDWYKSLAPGETGTVATFKAEYSALGGMLRGSIVFRDINVYNRHRSQHSNHTSDEGRALQDACKNIGLQQNVTKLTREDPFSGLVLTNMPGVRAMVLPCIADRKVVVAEMRLKICRASNHHPNRRRMPIGINCAASSMKQIGIA